MHITRVSIDMQIKLKFWKEKLKQKLHVLCKSYSDRITSHIYSK